MIGLNSVYENPLVQPGKYFVKVVQLRTDPLPGYVRPRILVQLLIHPDHGIGQDGVLVTAIHPYDTCRVRYQYFVYTFLAYNEDDLKLAINRWGYVEVYPDKYENVEYSNIRFIYQRNQIRVACALMNDQERQGEKVTLPYREGVFPSTPERKRSMGNVLQSLQAKELELIAAQVEDKWRKRIPGLSLPG